MKQLDKYNSNERKFREAVKI